MKIFIHEKDRELFSENQRVFLMFLESDAHFEKLVNKIRIMFDLPENIHQEDKLPKLDNRKHDLIKTISILLVGIYKNLSEEWSSTFAEIIETGFASPPQQTAISFSLDDNPFVMDEPYEKELKIVIRKKIKISDIKNFLTLHQTEINKLLEELPKNSSTKMMYIEIIHELKRIKKENNLKHHEDVVEKFEKETKKRVPTTLANYSEFNINISRYNDIRSRFLEKNFDGINILDSTLRDIRAKVK